ncbi:hypothetical protein V8B97DRAFT_1914893 [Scleroderma yunnanense]
MSLLENSYMSAFRTDSQIQHGDAQTIYPSVATNALDQCKPTVTKTTLEVIRFTVNAAASILIWNSPTRLSTLGLGRRAVGTDTLRNKTESRSLGKAQTNRINVTAVLVDRSSPDFENILSGVETMHQTIDLIPIARPNLSKADHSDLGVSAKTNADVTIKTRTADFGGTLSAGLQSLWETRSYNKATNEHKTQPPVMEQEKTNTQSGMSKEMGKSGDSGTELQREDDEIHEG